jgi:hypothetical protein
MDVDTVLDEHESLGLIRVIREGRTVPAMPDAPPRTADPEVRTGRVDAPACAVSADRLTCRLRFLRVAGHLNYAPRFARIIVRSRGEFGTDRGLQIDARVNPRHESWRLSCIPAIVHGPKHSLCGLPGNLR